MIDRSDLTYNLLDIGIMDVQDQAHMYIENSENPLEFKDLEYKTSICVAAPNIYRILLEQAGINALAYVEYDKNCCETLKCNRPKWNVI